MYMYLYAQRDTKSNTNRSGRWTFTVVVRLHAQNLTTQITAVSAVRNRCRLIGARRAGAGYIQ